MINATVVRGQLSSFIAKGFTAEEIKHSVASKDTYKGIGAEQRRLLFDIIEELLEEHLSFRDVQEVMNSQILLFHDTNNAALWDPVKKIKKPVNLSILRSIVDSKVLQNRLVPCYEGYNPRKNGTFYEEDGRRFFNSYTPPSWLKDYYYDGTSLPPVTELPEIYKTFFNHLTDGDEASLNYMIRWIANSLRNKNNIALTTIGKKGIGKGTLGNIIAKLHGNSNSNVTRGTQLGSRFNGIIHEKTFVYIDEIHIKNLEEENNFKTLANHEVEIEKKGQDQRKINNYANIYLSSNHLDSIKITSDERRFSIIDLTETKMQRREAYSSDFIPKIMALEDMENIKQLGYYLMGLNVNPSSMIDVFESDQTQRIRQAGFYDWETMFIHEFSVENAGKEVAFTEAISKLEYSGNTKFKLNRKSFSQLNDKLLAFTKEQPGKWVFKLNRNKMVDGKGRPYMFYFPKDSERAEIPIDLDSEE